MVWKGVKPTEKIFTTIRLYGTLWQVQVILKLSSPQLFWFSLIILLFFSCHREQLFIEKTLRELTAHFLLNHQTADSHSEAFSSEIARYYPQESVRPKNRAEKKWNCGVYTESKAHFHLTWLVQVFISPKQPDDLTEH